MNNSIGHNSKVGGIDTESLRSYVRRVESLEGEITDLNADKSEVYKEVDSAGFDKKIVKKVVSRRRLNPEERDNEDALVETYERALEEQSGDASRAHTRTHEEESNPAEPEESPSADETPDEEPPPAEPDEADEIPAVEPEDDDGLFGEGEEEPETEEPAVTGGVPEHMQLSTEEITGETVE